MTIITQVPNVPRRATKVSEGHRVVEGDVHSNSVLRPPCVFDSHLSEIPRSSIHHSGDAIDEFGRMKVHQKAQAAPSEPDVGVDLGEMHGKDL